MKRLSKDQKQQRADLITRLNDAAEAVRAALAAINAEIAGKLNSAIENYNLVVSGGWTPGGGGTRENRKVITPTHTPDASAAPLCRSRCTPSRRAFNCARKMLSITSQRRGWDFYRDEIEVQETHSNHRKLDSQTALSRLAVRIVFGGEGSVSPFCLRPFS